ncbi:aminopeptidase N [Drosophila biarmipes]|uniref:aminopeptidase N n=1 Tax=Drosophila biarmipes TaxID=125945 RepID=UPI0007E7597A|nr:aminopeptidase N [Drosophila biarmipes]XP_050743669.1 aminopeptidase N [Drosophila biarmipes]
MSQPTKCYLILLILAIPSTWATYDHYRLPNSLEPLHYNLRILTHLNSTDQRFEGSVKVEILAKESAKNITLHSTNLKIDEDRTSVMSDHEKISVTSIETNEVYNFYTLHLSQQLEKNTIYQLEMHFEASLNDSQSGYYKSNYTDAITKEVHHLAVTQFSPTFARQAFPCFDEPSWKSTFNVTLGYHKNYTGLSGTPIIGCQEHESLENYVWCDHEPLLRTSTYLVAYAVHDLRNAATQESSTHNGVIFRNWMEPKLLDQEMISLDMAPKLLTFYENLFQMDFPLVKIDQVTVPTHRFTAMENWGLVTYNEERLPQNTGYNLQEQKDQTSFTVAHEYAHQWFGNLVTMKWWNDLWLKEGPSTYFGYLALDALQPELTRGERFVDRDLANFFDKDSNATVPAISKDVKDPKEILAQFTEYVYQKGSLTMRMLHKLLGEEVFFQGIRSFLSRYYLRNVAQGDLWNSLQEAALQKKVIPSNFNLSRAMDSWTLQGGYPLVTLNRNYETGSLTLKQTRFFKGQELGNDTSCWWVPLSLVRQTLPNFDQTIPKLWLECPAVTEDLQLVETPSSDEWIILNPQVSTIFRVNYDEKNWRLIMNSLLNDTNFGGIHRLNRAQLIDDLLALAAVQVHTYDTAFDLLTYLEKERELGPWQRAVNIINKLRPLLDDEEAKRFKIYMQKLLLPLYKSFPKLSGITGSSTAIKDIPFAHFVYSQACRYHVDDCTDQAKILTISHRNGGNHELPSNFQQIAYCSFLEEGSETEFQEVFGHFQNTTNESQRRVLASSLGCSRNFKNFEKFLNYTLGSNEKPLSDCCLLAVKTALRRDHLVTPTGNYILNHAKILGEKFKKKELTGLLLGLAESLRSPEELEQLKDQLEDIKQFKESLPKALYLGKINQKWRKDCSSDFITALGKRI